MENDTTATTATAAPTPIAAAPVKPPASPVASPEVTLNQWALEASAKDKRVALLHGFVFEETVAKRFKDTEAAYAARYAAFANKPIK